MRKPRLQPTRFSPDMAPGVALAATTSNRTKLCRSAGRVSLVCPVCGVAFERKASEAKKYDVSYCGTACVGVASRRRKLTQCRVCGKEFAVKLSLLGVVTCCANPACNKQAHSSDLSLRDSAFWAAGRYARGAAHPSAKLTESETAAVIADPRTHSAIAADYGISRGRVGQIKRAAKGVAP